MCQIDHKLAVTAVHHFLGELLEVPAVEEASLALHSHPNGWTVHPYLNRRLHGFSFKDTRLTGGLSNCVAGSNGTDYSHKKERFSATTAPFSINRHRHAITRPSSK